VVKNCHQEAPVTATTPGAGAVPHHQGSQLNAVVYSVMQSPGEVTTGILAPIISDDYRHWLFTKGKYITMN